MSLDKQRTKPFYFGIWFASKTTTVRIEFILNFILLVKKKTNEELQEKEMRVRTARFM